MPHDHDGPLQCEMCGTGLRVLIKDNATMIVNLMRINLAVPKVLPHGLAQILTEAVRCFDCGSDIGAVVLCRLFTEGVLTEIGIKAEKLATQIEEAYKSRVIAKHTFHTASASRLVGNAGAHYSDDLETITSSEAEIVLRLVFQMAETLVPRLKAIKHN